MFSQKADYALRAMFDLAQCAGGGRCVRTAEIARRERIPEKFLELILVELRKAGLVKSQRGPEGGHRLARDASRITVGEIWRAMDGPLSSVLGADRAEGAERPSASCFHSVWKEVEKAVGQVVDHVTLADLCARAEARRRVVDFSI